MNISELRKKTKLSQKKFGDILGLSPQSILNYEAGANIPETVKKLIRYEFAEYLPEGEALYSTQGGEVATAKDERIKELEEECRNLLLRVAQLERREKELEKDKGDLRRDKEMLQLHIQTLTGKPKNNEVS